MSPIARLRAAGALFAAAPALAQDVGIVADGAAYFAETCAECHEDPAPLLEGRDLSDAAVVEELTGFLADHFAEAEGDRADVIAYLQSL